MRVVSLDPGVVVGRSALYQNGWALLHAGEETFLVDAPILPEELDALPAIVRQAGWEISGLLCTHGDNDHLLGRLAFPDAPLAASLSTADRLRDAPDAAAEFVRAITGEWRLEGYGELSLGEVQGLPVPGRLELGEQELELYHADGHSSDGMAIWVPWAAILLCGDYLSPVEIPWVKADGSPAAYLATLERLTPLVHRAAWVVPGHGAPLDRDRALAILEADSHYVRALPSPDAPLPADRDTPVQREVHEQNLQNLGAT